MGITVLDKPKIVADCQAGNYQDNHQWAIRLSLEDKLELFEKVVGGNKVVEIGCGVFGGLADLCLAYGCQSYVGIDKSIGDPKVSISTYNHRWGGFEEKTCVITIPEKIANDSRVEYFFGIDFYSFFRDLGPDSVVTISTGFFHDFTLTPETKGQNYIARGIREVARSTKCGRNVGLHHFMFDAYCKSPKSRKNKPEGTFFRKVFNQKGIKTKWADSGLGLWLLHKSYKQAKD